MAKIIGGFRKWWLGLQASRLERQINCERADREIRLLQALGHR
jgi:hypothetical protein